jgi:pimeloyl-ACP methyl ester carboxylesterase
VAIVGHSRGGMLGRALVARHPERVGHLVTLGSPLVAEPRDLHPLLQLQMRAMRELPPIGRLDLAGAGCARAYDTHRAGEAGEECCSRFWADLAAPLPAHVAFTSLYTRSDGVVRWRSCLDPEARCVEVPGSHCGLAFHPEVLRRVAETLAHPLPRPQRRARPARRAHLALAA